MKRVFVSATTPFFLEKIPQKPRPKQTSKPIGHFRLDKKKSPKKGGDQHQQFQFYTLKKYYLERLLCPIFLGNFTSNYCLKNSAFLGFPGRLDQKNSTETASLRETQTEVHSSKAGSGGGAGGKAASGGGPTAVA